MNLANYLTFARIAFIPVFIIVYYLPMPGAHIIAALIFAVAALTDWLDGVVARKLNQISPLGTFLDPVADKLMVAVVLVVLVAQSHLPYIVLPAAIIVGREIVISALREWMAEVGKRASVAVSYIGKVKTVTQMLALFLLVLLKDGSGLWITVFAYILLYFAALLTLWSMALYLKAAWPDLRDTRK